MSLVSLLKRVGRMDTLLIVGSITAFLFLACGYIACSRTSDSTLQQLRKKMVESQIRWRGVKDEQVLKAMLKVERHKFVPPKWIPYAYDDYPLPIGNDQTISQPFIVALMTELLKPKKTDVVLEIGTGSGYQAAILGEIVKEVYTIEIVGTLGKKAQALLNALEYKNIHVRIGDGYKGWPEKAPFDKIIVTAAPDHIPQPLLDQLKKGGRMVIPVGKKYQELLLITKDEKGIKKEDVIPVRFVPMTGEAEKR